LLILSLRLSEAEAGRFLQNRLQAVLIEGSSPQLAAVEIDNVAGGVLAADYLVAHGHRSIGFVGIVRWRSTRWAPVRCVTRDLWLRWGDVG
jgi:DNA-binding LacI/PurR family transcriptional regulator